MVTFRARSGSSSLPSQARQRSHGSGTLGQHRLGHRGPGQPGLISLKPHLGLGPRLSVSNHPWEAAVGRISLLRPQAAQAKRMMGL